ncbi:hypothetical protein [Massilia aerilata]|uniref:DUF4402 domain-containing protein n=1 Tax=Massilia aerilata TaxID=453817 RepID=A0ABW0S1H8_9BURK
MMKSLAAFVLLVPLAALAAGPKPLPDSELAAVRGADGISFAVDLNLNRQPDNTLGDSRLIIGQKVDERTTYIVLRNIGGRIQMVGLNISPQTAADGTNYVALTLPGYTRFTDTGFDSISVQADPHGAVSGNLGRISLNGEMMMQGQLRLWSH